MPTGRRDPANYASDLLFWHWPYCRTLVVLRTVPIRAENDSGRVRVPGSGLSFPSFGVAQRTYRLGLSALRGDDEGKLERPVLWRAMAVRTSLCLCPGRIALGKADSSRDASRRYPKRSKPRCAETCLAVDCPPLPGDRSGRCPHLHGPRRRGRGCRRSGSTRRRYQRLRDGADPPLTREEMATAPAYVPSR